jgi:hypothetical protein
MTSIVRILDGVAHHFIDAVSRGRARSCSDSSTTSRPGKRPRKRAAPGRQASDRSHQEVGGWSALGWIPHGRAVAAVSLAAPLGRYWWCANSGAVHLAQRFVFSGLETSTKLAADHSETSRDPWLRFLSHRVTLKLGVAPLVWRFRRRVGSGRRKPPLRAV